MVLLFLFPQKAGTDILDYLHKQRNKTENILQLASEISGMNCQEHPSNGSRNAAKNVRCSSGRVY